MILSETAPKIGLVAHFNLSLVARFNFGLSARFPLESFNKKQFCYNAVIDKETFIKKASEIILSIFDNMYDNRDDPEELSSYLECLEPVISKKISEIIKNENQNELTSKQSKGRGR